MPRISVLIPAYNGAPFLAEALESILAQTLDPHEIVVVDDCSTDETVTIAETFAPRGVRVEGSPSRRGLAGNWNRCLELATGDYVCVFHQDDLMRPDNLASKGAMLDLYPQMTFVYSAAKVIDGSGNDVPESQARRDDLPFGTRIFQPGEYLDVLLERNVIRASSVVARREALSTAGPFRDLTYLPDWEMWLRLAEQGSVGWIDEPLVSARWHAASETHQQRRDDADLHEYARLLPELIERYAPRVKNPSDVKARAHAAFASGCMNRAYHALSVEQDSRRARDWLLRAIDASPRSMSGLIRDPRWGMLAVLLFVAPGVAARWAGRPRD